MDDLISRAAAIECAIDAIDDWDGGWNPNRETVIRKYFEELPAVDAAPVIHGQWIWMSSTFDRMPCEMRYRCSECHHETITHVIDPWEDYCPHCGARMDGERRDT